MKPLYGHREFPGVSLPKRLLFTNTRPAAQTFESVRSGIHETPDLETLNLLQLTALWEEERRRTGELGRVLLTRIRDDRDTTLVNFYRLSSPAPARLAEYRTSEERRESASAEGEEVST